MNPSITPKMSNVVVLWNFEATVTTSMEVSSAPRKAAVATVNPDQASGSDVPMSRVAIAAPVPAPALTPIMCGSASGLRNTLCI